MDIAITYDELKKYFDISLTGGDLTTDEGLATAVVISLFTDRKAEEDDELPDGTNDRRGWWGDAFSDHENDRIGSRLWLLSRSKQTTEVARQAETYAREALEWMVEDGVAAKVAAETEWVATGVLGLVVKITRPDGTPLTFKFDNLWEAMNAV